MKKIIIFCVLKILEVTLIILALCGIAYIFSLIAIRFGFQEKASDFCSYFVKQWWWYPVCVPLWIINILTLFPKNWEWAGKISNKLVYRTGMKLLIFLLGVLAGIILTFGWIWWIG